MRAKGVKLAGGGGGAVKQPLANFAPAVDAMRTRGIVARLGLRLLGQGDVAVGSTPLAELLERILCVHGSASFPSMSVT